MELSKLNLKLRENKTAGGHAGLDQARFVLSSNPGKGLRGCCDASYAILTALGSGRDILIELNSSMFCCADNLKENTVYGFIDNLKALSIDYIYRKVQPAGSPNLMERILNRPRSSAHEVLACIPGVKWSEEGVKDLITPYGARYYITAVPQMSKALLDEFLRMTDEEKLGFFSLIVFDIASMGQIGINTNVLGLNDIKGLLGTVQQ